MVDPVWLESVRAKNRKAYGLGGLGAAAAAAPPPRRAYRDIDIVGAHRDERKLRTQSIHAGRFEERDPNKPTEGSVESIAAALGPASAFGTPQRTSNVMTWALGLAIAGTVGLIAYRMLKD